MFTTVEGGTAAVIGGLYLLTNGARVFAYLPQIAAVWRSQNGAQAISILTWALWTVANAAALLYGALVMDDLYFVAITVINFVGCGIVTLLAIWRRDQYRRAQPGTGGAETAVQPPRKRLGALRASRSLHQTGDAGARIRT